jgi:hypothetical protein
VLFKMKVQRASLFWTLGALIASFAIFAYFDFQKRSAQTDALLQTSRSEQRAKREATEASKLAGLKPSVSATVQSNESRAQTIERNQIGDLLRAPWYGWFSAVTQVVGDDAAILDFKVDLAAAAQNRSDPGKGERLESTFAAMQIEFKDDTALGLMLDRASKSSKFNNVRIESAVDGARGVERYLLVKLSMELRT